MTSDWLTLWPALPEQWLASIFIAFFAIWLFVLGSAIGSFLNVIIYRMPRGLSLVHPKSRCPKCLTSIRVRDNVPIWGWIQLRGKCRACGLAISPRYPIVEAMIAVLVTALAWMELYHGGSNLPGNGQEISWNGVFLSQLKPELFVRFAYHCWLIIVAVAVGWIVWDHFPPPRRLVTTTLLLGLAIPIIAPNLRPSFVETWDILPSWPIPYFESLRLDGDQLIEGALGLVLGFAFGMLVSSGTPRLDDKQGALFACSMVGLFLGWGALLTFVPMAALFSACMGITGYLARANFPMTFSYVLALLIQVYAWRWTAIALTWVATTLDNYFQSPIIALLCCVVVIVLLFTGIRRLCHRDSVADDRAIIDGDARFPNQEPT